MWAFLLNIFAIEAQYICTAALILICTLAGAHLYLMHIRKTDAPHAADTKLSEQNKQAEEEHSESKNGSGEIAALPFADKELARSEIESVKLSDYPYEAATNLLERGLIKLENEEESSTDSDSPIGADFEKREHVFVMEARNLISDEVAVSLIEETEETVLSTPKAVINIDALSENYQANETVTLKSLKEKKLIATSVNYVKVLARGVLDKPLIVKMPDFSVDAVKMILLTGGTVIKLKTKSK